MSTKLTRIQKDQYRFEKCLIAIFISVIIMFIIVDYNINKVYCYHIVFTHKNGNNDNVNLGREDVIFNHKMEYGDDYTNLEYQICKEYNYDRVVIISVTEIKGFFRDKTKYEKFNKELEFVRYEKPNIIT